MAACTLYRDCSRCKLNSCPERKEDDSPTVANCLSPEFKNGIFWLEKELLDWLQNKKSTALTPAELCEELAIIINKIGP